MRAHVTMIALVCLLTQGCASTESVVPLTELKSVKASPPADTVKPCEAPVLIPSGALSAGATERLWGRDRAALASCGAKHIAVVTFYRNRDAGLASK